MKVRPATVDDAARLAIMRNALWPEGSVEEHASELEAIFGGEWSRIFPYVILVGEADDGTLVGFAEVTVRSRADGCDPSRPVAYLEGWYVDHTFRRQGVGRELLLGAEDWGRLQGCIEIASDTWIDNPDSQRAHEALGFEVVDRCVNFRKALTPSS